MRQPHFFKSYSRLGVPFFPIRQNKLNLGVEDSPDFVITKEFLGEFENPGINEYRFPKPEDVLKEDYYQVLADHLEKFKDLIQTSLKEGETQVVIGGENSVTFSSLLAVLERVKDSSKVGYIQFDSHGEMNSFEGSESKNFHGMYMRPFFEKFDKAEIAELMPFQLGTDQVITIGDLVLDGDEPEFYKKNNIRNINREDYINNKLQIQSELKTFIEKFEHIHINFDVDVFHHSISPATGIAGDGKWMFGEVIDLVEVINKHPSISLDMCEINPHIEGASKTIEVAHEVLREFLQFDKV